MLLTQLFYIGSNIFPPHTHAPLANPAQSNPCSGNHLGFFFFLGFRDLQIAALCWHFAALLGKNRSVSFIPALYPPMYEVLHKHPTDDCSYVKELSAEKNRA